MRNKQVHKVHKVRGPLRGAWSTAAHAADKHRPKDTRDLMDLIDLIDLIDLMDFVDSFHLFFFKLFRPSAK